jgi:hypothetical protein
MKGDFSRFTFDPQKHFLRVLMQQGRVLLDADWNEQVAILLHNLHTLTRDLVGDFAGPRPEPGFKIGKKEEQGKLTDLTIGPGRYYVDGIPVEALGENLSYVNQHAVDGTDRLPDPPYLVYLDVWERHVTCTEDESIREVALGAADTGTRTKVVWCVRTESIGTRSAKIPKDVWDSWAEWEETWQPKNRGRLQAQAKEPKSSQDKDPCPISPTSGYRGLENQLYRVEIHSPGEADSASFKWSRDNGAVVFPIDHVDGNKVTVTHLGQDGRSTLNVDDRVEVVDDRLVLRGAVKPLRRVSDVDHDNLVVTLEGAEALPAYKDSNLHPLLRRWDHKRPDKSDGCLALKTNEWLKIEKGIEVWFDKGHAYRTGDYWLIPARTATGDIIWRRNNGEPQAVGPDGIEHHYAPLAIVTLAPKGAINVTDLRRRIKDLWEEVPS